MSLPEVIVSVGSGSNRYDPGKLYFNPAYLSEDVMPLFVGASCATSDFAASEHRELGLPLFERLLTYPSAGPVAWVGPTAGTWQSGNAEVARHVVRALFADTSRPMAESWLEAIREVISENLTQTGSQIVQTARSYVYLGDPLSQLRHAFEVPTGVDDDTPQSALRLHQNAPNPFLPMTSITFTTTRRGYVSLRIYDIRGKLVRNLVDQTIPSGRHEVNWNGTDEHGHQVPGSVYMYRLEAEGVSVTRKLTVAR